MSTGQRQLDRSAVMKVATSLVEECVEELTLTRMATVLGVTQPALYRHVDGIQDVWRQLGLDGRRCLAASLAEASIGHSGRSAVTAAAAAWRDFALQHRGLYQATDRYGVAGDRELEEAVERVVAVLALAIRGFAMSDDDTAHGARVMRSALHGFVSFEMGAGLSLPHDVDQTFERLVDLLCLGFESWAVRS